MASFYDLTIGQGIEFQRIIADVLSAEDAKRVIRNPSLARNIPDVLAAQSPKSALVSQSSIPWTPVDQYVYRIMTRSSLRGWGFTYADALMLATKLHDHDGPLTPTGVSIWLGKNLGYNWTEMTAWIEDEVKALGFTFRDDIGLYQHSFLSNIRQECRGRKLDVVDLDLVTFWDPTNGVIPRNVRFSRPKWPGLEVATLLALNPQVCVAMDGKTIPHMFAPGLFLDIGNFLLFNRNDRLVYVSGGWDDSRWCKASMVAYRE